MKDIINNMVKNNICTGCGACVSESGGTLKMRWDENGFLVPEVLNFDVPADVLRVCPFNPSPDEDVKDEDHIAKEFLNNTGQFDERIGHYENTYVGYSKEFRETSSSGGIATYVFQQLLKEKVVDHLYIVKDVNGTYEYRLFSNFEDIKAISKTRYIPVTMEEFFSKLDKIEGKVAISGVACFIKAVRLKQHYHPELKEKIPFLIGIICGGWKSRFFTDFLAQNAGIKNDYHHPQYRIKDKNSTASDYSFGAFDMNNDFHQMKMAKVGDMWGTGLFKAYACEFCTDVLTELADISLGDAWLPEYRLDGMGTSVIVTRSALADQMIKSGIADSSLDVNPIGKEKIIQSQRASFAHRQDAMRFRLKIAKIKGHVIPYVRKRVLKSISLHYAIVQYERLRTREKSLFYWRDTKNAAQFARMMRSTFRRLIFVTQVYHKLNALAKKLSPSKMLAK